MWCTCSRTGTCLRLLCRRGSTTTPRAQECAAQSSSSPCSLALPNSAKILSRLTPYYCLPEKNQENYVCIVIRFLRNWQKKWRKALLHPHHTYLIQHLPSNPFHHGTHNPGFFLKSDYYMYCIVSMLCCRKKLNLHSGPVGPPVRSSLGFWSSPPKSLCSRLGSRGWRSTVVHTTERSSIVGEL